ncbi:MAG: hypothetical protein JSW72_05725 [Candidatus Bathyarchaeota archaeon]|nr:MAG: hypothetical protein JSW72_05725 [Candidatus Bathyarchaeota archaeon]
MKRWVLLLGRGGTVLLTIGLALLLVSLIPSAQLATSAGSTAIPPEWVQDVDVETILTPQQGLQIAIVANGTLDVYILEVSSHVLYEWVGDDFLNVSNFEEFLEANPSSIGWHGEVRNGTITHEYVPTKVTNATLVFSNPSSEWVPVDFEVSKTSRIAPGMKVRNLAQWAIPIGVVLALPWFVQMWKKRRGSGT